MKEEGGRGNIGKEERGEERREHGDGNWREGKGRESEKGKRKMKRRKTN